MGASHLNYVLNMSSENSEQSSSLFCILKTISFFAY